MSELPETLVARFESRIHDRGGERELRFLYRHRDPLLPIWHDGQLQVVRWGNGLGQSRKLPRTGWTWLATVESGGWGTIEAEPVEIPTNAALENGVWYHVRQGIRGLVVYDERATPVVYMICEPASHYYEIMTRSKRMPLLIEEII